MQRLVTWAEVSGLALLTLGGAALLVAPAREVRDALARRLHTLTG